MKKSHLILGLLFLAFGCTNRNQKNTISGTKIDTAKLFDPYPQENKIVENGEVLCNGVMVEKDNVAVSAVCQKADLHNDQELVEWLRNNKNDIYKQKFYIVYSNNTSAKRVIDIIDIVKTANIYDYKVIKLESVINIIAPKVKDP